MAVRAEVAERDHLHHLAGEPPPVPLGPSREVRRSILDLITRLPTAAATVLSLLLRTERFGPELLRACSSASASSRAAISACTTG